jgi:alanine racemase
MNMNNTTPQKPSVTHGASMGSGDPAPLPRLGGPEGPPCDQVDPWLEIKIPHLKWNVAQVQKHVGETPIMAVVKCNAYGHGAVGIAKILEAQGIQQFAVVKVQEAVLLREQGIQGILLNFGPFSASEAEQLVRHDITQSVYSETVDTLAAAAKRLGTSAKVHVKVDTGLSRVGVPYPSAVAYLERLAAMPNLVMDGIFTTLAGEDDFDPIQLERLHQVCDDAAAKGISVGVRHAASTDAVVTRASAFLDLVRPGNCFYGFEPLPPMELKPVLSLKTRVILVKTVVPGDTISYHRRLTIDTPRRLAILPLGYADGYPFQAVDKAEVLIRGRRWPVIVYMSGNHATVDITGAEDIQIGDEVVVIGTQGDETITLQEVATWAGSSVYKVATAMSPFLPRFFLE